MSLNLVEVNQINLDNPGDVQRLGRLVSREATLMRPYLLRLAQTWVQNVLFYEGLQWLNFNDQTSFWAPIKQSDFGGKVPMPITNLISPAVTTISSLFLRGKPSATVFPMDSESIEDQGIAEIGKLILQARWKADNEDQNLLKIVLCCILMGTVFRKDYWDDSVGRAVDLGEGYSPIPIGENKSEVLTPFEVIPDIYDESWFLEAKVRELNWVKSIFGKTGNGFTGRANDLKSTTLNNATFFSSVLRYREQLRFTTGGNPWTSGPELGVEDGHVIVIEGYIRPTQNHPNGLMIVICNDQVLYCAPSPYYYKSKKDSWHPYSYWKWQESPTRWHGISLVEQLVPIQKQINKLYAYMELCRLMTSNPIWLIPETSGVPKGFPKAEPGAEIRYSATGINGDVAPTRLPGLPLDMTLFQYIDVKKKEFQMVSRESMLLGGGKPAGADTASALNLLLEQTMQSFGPQVRGFEGLIESFQGKKLQLIQKHYKEPRPELFKQVTGMSESITPAKLSSFIFADIETGFDVSIESGSSLPASKTLEQQTLKELMQLGVFGKIDPSNPVTQAEFLQRFGIVSFTNVIDNNIARAKENVRILTQMNQGELGPESYPQFKPYENIDLQIQFLVQQMVKPSFVDTQGWFDKKYNELLAIKNQMNAGQPTQEIPQENGAPQRETNGMRVEAPQAPVAPPVVS